MQTEVEVHPDSLRVTCGQEVESSILRFLEYDFRYNSLVTQITQMLVWHRSALSGIEPGIFVGNPPTDNYEF